MSNDIDLLIDGDFVLQPGGEPTLTTQGRACVQQDILHMVYESGLLSVIIGERDNIKIDATLIQIEVLIEDNDSRVTPGTINVEILSRNSCSMLFIAAESIYGSLNIDINLNQFFEDVVCVGEGKETDGDDQETTIENSILTESGDFLTTESGSPAYIGDLAWQSKRSLQN